MLIDGYPAWTCRRASRISASVERLAVSSRLSMRVTSAGL
jgi:hypothetical protein